MLNILVSMFYIVRIIKFVIINKKITMYEKILQALKDARDQNSNVSDRSIEDMAKTLSTIVTTDEQLTIIDTKSIVSTIDGNINHVASLAVKKTVEEKQLEEKQLEAKKAAEEKKMLEDAKNASRGSKVDNNSMTESSELMKKIEQMQSQIEQMQADKTVNSQFEKLNSIIKDTPEYLKNPILETFKKSKFEEEEVFNSYLESIKKSVYDFNTEAKKQGLNTSAPIGEPVIKQDDDINPIFKQALESTKKEE